MQTATTQPTTISFPALEYGQEGFAEQAAAVKAMIFTSADETPIQVCPTDSGAWAIASFIRQGFTSVLPMVGSAGASELACATGQLGKQGVAAFVRPDDHGYGLVLMRDGSTVSGCIKLHGNGRFCLC